MNALFLISLVFSSTIVGNPINGLRVLVDSDVYQHNLKVVPCEGEPWSTEEEDVWISAACRVELEVCDEDEACWLEVIETRPEGATLLSVGPEGYSWN